MQVWREEKGGRGWGGGGRRGRTARGKTSRGKKEGALDMRVITHNRGGGGE